VHANQPRYAVSQITKAIHWRRDARPPRALPVKYREVKIDCGYRLDFLVEVLVIVEIKSVDKIAPIDKAQVITYLKLMDRPVGLSC
jgi:GxxExxY protein